MLGNISEVVPGGKYNVKLQNGHKLLCHLSGKMTTNSIKLVLGDVVTVEISKYDLTKGIITYRGKKSY